MPRPQRSDERLDEVRQSIRAAALELYREGGVPKITIRGVASRLGMAPGSIYNYFTNRQALLEFLWREPTQAFDRRVSKRAARIADPLKRIELIQMEYIKFERENPEVYRGACMTVYLQEFPEEARTHLRDSATTRLLIEAIKEAQDRGLIVKQDPVLLTQALWSAVHGALALPINLPMIRFRRSDTVARLLARSILQGLRPE